MAVNPPWAPQTIPIWPAGYQASTELFNNLGQATLGWLANRFMFRALRVAAQSISSGTNTVVAYDTIIEDPYQGWATVAANAWTVPFTGWYEITVGNCVNAAAVVLSAGVGVTGQYFFFAASNTANASFQCGVQGTYVVQMNAGTDYIQGLIFSSQNASTTTSTAGFQPSIEVFFLSQ